MGMLAAALSTIQCSLPKRSYVRAPRGAYVRTTCSACPFSGTFSTREPDYLPFKSSPYKLTMGLSPITASDWIELDDDYMEEVEQRRQLLKEQRNVVLSSMDIPEAHAANKELLEVLSDYLPKEYPDRYSFENGIITNNATGEAFDLRDPNLDLLEAAGLLVQEDFAIMQKLDDGPVRFVSGVVCFPMRWTMREKIGLAITDIHDPVPFFREEISKYVENFFERLSPGKPFMRANWTIMDTPDLYVPIEENDIRSANAGAKIRGAHVTAEDAGERLFLRVERQAFHRFPRTGASLFTIRTYVRPLKEFEDRPEVAARLAAAVRNLPVEVERYKSLIEYKEEALEYLDRVCASHMAPV